MARQRTTPAAAGDHGGARRGELVDGATPRPARARGGRAQAAAGDDYVPRPLAYLAYRERVASDRRRDLLDRRADGDAVALATPLPLLAADAELPSCGRPH